MRYESIYLHEAILMKRKMWNFQYFSLFYFCLIKTYLYSQKNEFSLQSK